MPIEFSAEGAGVCTDCPKCGNRSFRDGKCLFVFCEQDYQESKSKNNSKAVDNKQSSEITVSKLIEKLLKFDRNAVVCIATPDGDGSSYSSIETIHQIENAKFINDNGDTVTDNIISIC